MVFAVLPFNVAAGTPEQLGRQIANFAADVVRSQASNSENLRVANFLQQVNEDGQTRAAFINVADTMLERQWLDSMIKDSELERLMDGLLKQTDDGYEITVRVIETEVEGPLHEETWSFKVAELFSTLGKLIGLIVKYAEPELEQPLDLQTVQYGTDKPETFVKFLEGYDALAYIRQANGAVVRSFDVGAALNTLLEAVKEDPDFVAPYDTLVQLCRSCAAFKLGSFDQVKGTLEELAKIAPDDFKAYFALGDVYEATGRADLAVDQFEKAMELEPNEPALVARLGLAQMNSGMPVNAERNFRKAMSMEGDDKPSAELLAQVLAQTGRIHEVPPLWKELLEKNPQNAHAHARYAISLIQAGKRDEGVQAFETGIETVQENLPVKRFYAPLLAEKGDLDRAMDFYEDCLDVTPADVPLLLEYAQTLKKAEREFEIPKVLHDVLHANPDPNTRASTLAWLIELEQPKRVEVVESAQKLMEAEKFDEAIRELRPLRNWLADYWKLWALLAPAYNRVKDFPEAEAASKKLLDLFPGYEPAFSELMQSISMQDRQDEAYGLMRFAAMNNPQSLPIHLNLAIAAKRAGREDEARQLAKQIREAVGPNEEVEKILAEVEG